MPTAKFSLMLSVVLMSAAPALAGTYSFKVLPYSEGSQINGFGDTGQVAGQVHVGPSPGGHAIQRIWTPEPSGPESIANLSMHVRAINAKGIAVGQRSTTNPLFGYAVPLFYDTHSGLYRRIPLVSPDDPVIPLAINTPGVVAGTIFFQGNLGGVGFVLRGSSAVTFEAPDSNLTYATGINDSGVVTGYGSTPTSPPSGFVLEGGTYTSIRPPNAAGVEPSFITNDGTVGGKFTDTAGVVHGFTYGAGAVNVVTYPGASATRVVGIGPGGEVFGNASVAGKTVSFVDVHERFSRIAFPGAASTLVAFVNASGAIAGNFTDSSGVVRLFRAACDDWASDPGVH